jgi:pyridoxal phosphate-dependent aminotransferase EpsN
MGFNYRLSNILAGVGRAQLEILEERVKARRLIFNRYYQELSHISGVHFMPELEETFSNRWLTSLYFDEEVEVNISSLLKLMTEENIEVRPVWKPLHLQPLFNGVKYYHHRENENISEKLFDRGICLPSGSNMTLEDQMRVIDCMKRAIREKVK